MFQKSLAELTISLQNKEISSVELAKVFLDRISKFTELNAFLDLQPEITIEQAELADKIIASGAGGPLTGIPIAHKDIFVTQDFVTTAGSKMLKNYLSPFEATVVKRLKEAGMVTLGKLNCDEFAMGSSNENSFYGHVLNPWDKRAVPGGSSGGSASAVASRLAPVASATDTGGSIREPAAFCGGTGMKPTYGRASRWGMVAFASSLDQAGIISRSAQDVAVVLETMLGFDPLDSTSVDYPNEKISTNLNLDLNKMKLGVPTEFFSVEINAEVKNAINGVLKTLGSLGVELVEISLPKAHLGIPVYYAIAPAECSSNLSRFDGVRYGYRASDYDDIVEMIKKTRSEGFGDEPKRRIMIGTYVLSKGYYDAYYVKAQKVRKLIIDDFKNAFKECDFIISPVTSDPAFNLGEKTNDPISMYYSDRFTIPASLAGIPAMSIPCGFSSQGRPIGVQLMGNYFKEANLLGLAHQYQKITDWHKRIPSEFD